MKTLKIVTIVLLVGISTGIMSGANASTNGLPDVAKHWVELTLSKVDPDMELSEVENILGGSVRNMAYVSTGLLLRDGRGDRELANAMLKQILQLQLTDPADSYGYGSFQKNTKKDEDTDENWREFVGTALITSLEVFPEKISDENKANMKTALIKAGEGAMWRNVGADYSNIAIMSAFLMEYAGKLGDRQDMYDKGRAKAKEVYDLYKKYGTLSEFNSPTYGGVCMTGFGFWKNFSPSQETKDMGRELQNCLWQDIADFYHPTMLNMCGPYFRGYGMDMRKYNALTGFWITMANNDKPNRGSIAGLDAEKTGELYSFPLSAIVYEAPPRKGFRKK